DGASDRCGEAVMSDLTIDSAQQFIEGQINRLGEFATVHSDHCVHAVGEEGECEPLSGEWPLLPDPALLIEAAETAPDGAEFCQVIEIAWDLMGFDGEEE